MRPRIKKATLITMSSRYFPEHEPRKIGSLDEKRLSKKILSTWDMVGKYSAAAEEARKEGLSRIAAEMQDACEREYAVFCTLINYNK